MTKARNQKILDIIEKSKKSHNTKNGLFLEKYIGYYNMSIKDNYVLYESFNGQGIIDNPYGIFRAFLRRLDFVQYIHIWVIDDFEEKWYQIMEFTNLPNVRFVKYGSDQYLEYLSTSKYLINNCTFPPYFIKKDEQIYINTWHGIPIKCLGYDVPNSRLTLGNTMRNFLSADYLLTASDHMTDVWLRGYKLDGLYEGTIIQEGQPRMDLCYQNKDYVISKLRSFGVEIDPNKKVILYAPTWSGTLSNPNEINYQEIFDSVDTSKYQILYKPHHVNYKKKKEFIPSAMDANELISICDVLITDFSSICYDFMDLGKPVIFYVPNFEDYKKKQGLYNNWNFSNTAYNLDTLKVYLRHIDLLQKPYSSISYTNNGDKILSIILDHQNGNIIRPKNDKMKLLFYIGDFKPNGVTTSFMSLTQSLDYSKFDVSLIVLNKKGELYEQMINDINPNVRVLCRAGTYAQTLLEECAKDITLQLGIGTDYLYNLLPKEMYKREFKRCFGLSKFDKLINFTGYSPFYSYLFMCADGEKIVWLHNDMILDRERNINGVKPLYTTLSVVFTTYPYYDKLISASEEIMKINIQNFPEIPEERFYYAHNTLDYDRVLRLSEINTGIPIDRTKINFCNNGRLSPAKNQEALIRAFNRFAEDVPDCELYIIGDGELREHLELIAGDHVHIVGFQKNPYWLMDQCDYFIFPSLYEGQGISLLEARVLGLPIVVSDLPKMKGIFIENGQYNIGGFSEELILDGLYHCIESETTPYDFDARKYNQESYNEFEVVICG